MEIRRFALYYNSGRDTRRTNKTTVDGGFTILETVNEVSVAVVIRYVSRTDVAIASEILDVRRH